MPNPTIKPPERGDTFPSMRLPLLANAARNLAGDLSTHLPDKMLTADHATIARLTAAQMLRTGAAYAALAHALATSADEPALDEFTQRIEGCIAEWTALDELSQELRRRMPMVCDVAMTRAAGRAFRGAT